MKETDPKDITRQENQQEENAVSPTAEALIDTLEADTETDSYEKTKKSFAGWKIFIPGVIGLTVVVWMFIHDAKKENLAAVWESIHFDTRAILCIVLAFLFMLGRDFGLSWRFRALADRKIKWRSAFEIDFLCEFTSCITPSAVGGSSMGMFFLNSKGIEMGRATTLMMTTLFLDELFFVVSCPIIVLFTPAKELFNSVGDDFSHGIKLTFWIVYAIIFAWTFILFMGIIWKPKWISTFLAKITSWKLLRKWHDSAVNLADNMVATGNELRTKPFKFWLEVFGGTALSWTSRYLVVNALFLGFVASADSAQWLIFAREFVLWVVLMASPTPGGSGLSEWLFSEYYGDLVTTAGMALILAVFWRIISYYVYLIIGAIIVPGWLKNSYNKYRKPKKKKTSTKNLTAQQS